MRKVDSQIEDSQTCYPNLDLRLDPIRTNARFDDLLGRLGFAP